MAKFMQAFLLAFLVVAMVAPDCEATFFKHKFFYKHPVYVQKYHHYAPVVHRPVYYRAVPVYYKAPRRKYYKRKHYKG